MVTRNALIAAAAGALGLGLLAAPAEASCFYNHTPFTNIDVRLYCGWLCNNEWTISKGGHNCRGGSGGAFAVGVPGSATKKTGKVDDHGYVTVEGECTANVKRLRLHVWSEGHSLQSESSWLDVPTGECTPG
ncbi:MAG TPA: hypothetical protein VD995_14665 [Azospirillum sp.]|nr:hypothetical protein [Azospirillum sp.]